ncbi:hypothetical protein O181_013266 [Austropuccinia psidii MF-1]|uniref:Uncharacterized protein n=1 Tax=Austropuccinia psidii MF-1 TaxID=1389203 RepID=A0A9Q3BW39_9BASI|nr:hypothetical protein [Austropuccinia psidii MF-1]
MLELASASLPNPLQSLACLSARDPLQMGLQHCPHHSLAYNPYAAVRPSGYASDAALTPPLCLLTPAAYHPYACSALPTCLQSSLPSLHL